MVKLLVNGGGTDIKVTRSRCGELPNPPLAAAASLLPGLTHCSLGPMSSQALCLTGSTSLSPPKTSPIHASSYPCFEITAEAMLNPWRSWRRKLVCQLAVAQEAKQQVAATLRFLIHSVYSLKFWGMGTRGRLLPRRLALGWIGRTAEARRAHDVI
jgi:hypothetical protein